MIRRLYTYLVAEWPMMLNDVVIAVVVVIVTEVVVRFTMMFGTTVVIAVVDDMMVLSHRMLESDWTEDDELVPAYMYSVYLIVT